MEPDGDGGEDLGADERARSDVFTRWRVLLTLASVFFPAAGPWICCAIGGHFQRPEITIGGFFASLLLGGAAGFARIVLDHVDRDPAPRKRSMVWLVVGLILLIPLLALAPSVGGALLHEIRDVLTGLGSVE